MNRFDICIVEDEPEIAELCRDLLSDKYNVTTFLSAPEALAAFQKGYRPTLVVSDINMPDMTGLEFVAECNVSHSGYKFVIMSGYAEKSHVLEAYEKKVAGFVEKPFNPYRLKALIDEIVTEKVKSEKILSLLKLYEDLEVYLLENEKGWAQLHLDKIKKLKESEVI